MKVLQGLLGITKKKHTNGNGHHRTVDKAADQTIQKDTPKKIAAIGTDHCIVQEVDDKDIHPDEQNGQNEVDRIEPEQLIEKYFELQSKYKYFILPSPRPTGGGPSPNQRRALCRTVSSHPPDRRCASALRARPAVAAVRLR